MPKISPRKNDTPAVVFMGNRPYAVDQNLEQTRGLMLDQIKNFKRKDDLVPNVKSPQDRDEKKIYDSSERTSKTQVESNNDKGSEEIQSEEADSGAEEGSSEPSPEPEKFVSKFSFPQKPKRDPVKLEEKRKASASSAPTSEMCVQEEVTVVNQQLKPTGKVILCMYISAPFTCLVSPKDLTLYQAFDGYLDGYGPGLGSEFIL